MTVSFSDQRKHRKVKMFSVSFKVLVLQPGFYLPLVLFHIIMEDKHLKIYLNEVGIYGKVIRS